MSKFKTPIVGEEHKVLNEILDPPTRTQRKPFRKGFMTPASLASGGANDAPYAAMLVGEK